MTLAGSRVRRGTWNLVGMSADHCIRLNKGPEEVVGSKGLANLLSFERLIPRGTLRDDL